ncbi:MAG: hypothetical protein K2R98_18385 [Gemmataceae bacterium]|nr:hypothetical protein [Gemmataceae bacterium]
MSWYYLSAAITLAIVSCANAADQPVIATTSAPTQISEGQYAPSRPSFGERLRRLFRRGDVESSNGTIITSSPYQGGTVTSPSRTYTSPVLSGSAPFNSARPLPPSNITPTPESLGERVIAPSVSPSVR